MPLPQGPGPLSRGMHTHLLMHPTRPSDSDWWAPLQPLPSVAGAPPPLAFSSHRRPLGSQYGASLFRETPLSPALSCQGTLPGARPLSLIPALKMPPSPRPISMWRDYSGRQTCDWPTFLHSSHGKFGTRTEHAQLCPFPSFPRPACPQKVCIQLLLLLLLPHVKACPWWEGGACGCAAVSGTSLPDSGAKEEPVLSHMSEVTFSGLIQSVSCIHLSAGSIWERNGVMLTDSSPSPSYGSILKLLLGD